MRSFDHERDTFTIEVPAWATVETIGRILKDLQTQARMGKIQPISPKKLALVDFVSEGLTCGQSWEQIHLAWNQTHSKDKYPARDGAGFKKAYRDSYRLVMFGGIQWPGRIEKKYLPPAAVPDLEGRKPTKPTARRPGRRKQR